jgi:hypothetical protein
LKNTGSSTLIFFAPFEFVALGFAVSRFPLEFSALPFPVLQVSLPAVHFTKQGAISDRTTTVVTQASAPMTQLVVALSWHRSHVAGLGIRPSLISHRAAFTDQPLHEAPAGREATTSQGRTHFSRRLEKAAVEVDFFFILPLPLEFSEFIR